MVYFAVNRVAFGGWETVRGFGVFGETDDKGVVHLVFDGTGVNRDVGVE